MKETCFPLWHYQSSNYHYPIKSFVVISKFYNGTGFHNHVREHEVITCHVSWISTVNNPHDFICSAYAPRWLRKSLYRVCHFSNISSSLIKYLVFNSPFCKGILHSLSYLISIKIRLTFIKSLLLCFIISFYFYSFYGGVFDWDFNALFLVYGF